MSCSLQATCGSLPNSPGSAGGRHRMVILLRRSSVRSGGWRPSDCWPKSPLDPASATPHSPLRSNPLSISSDRDEQLPPRRLMGNLVGGRGRRHLVLHPGGVRRPRRMQGPTIFPRGATFFLHPALGSGHSGLDLEPVMVWIDARYVNTATLIKAGFPADFRSRQQALAPANLDRAPGSIARLPKDDSAVRARPEEETPARKPFSRSRLTGG